MERKSVLVVSSLLIILVVVCINWYSGLDSYSREHDITIQEDLTYEEAMEKSKDFSFRVDFDHTYYSKERLVVSYKKTLMPFVFKKDTLFSSGVDIYKVPK